MRKNWKKILAFAVGGCLLLLLLAPTIAVRTGLVANIINRYSGLNGKIEFDSASIGWFSPTKFKNLHILDSEGNTAAKANVVSLSKSLSGLMFSGTSGANVSLQQCELVLDRKEGQLNWQTLFTEKPSSEKSTPLQMQIDIEDLKLVVNDENSNGELAGCNGVIKIYPDQHDSNVQLIGFDFNAADKLILTGQFGVDQTGTPNSVETNVDANVFDVSIINPILDHFGLPKVAATLKGKSTVQWLATADPNPLDIEFSKFSINRVDDRSLVEGYPIVPLQVDGAVHVNSQRDSKLAILTDYGSMTLDGQLPGTNTVNLQELAGVSCKLEGDFDLARFASDFPDWVHVKKGVKLQSGKVIFSAFNRLEGAKQRMLIDVRSDALLAQFGGRVIEWNKPILASCALTRPANDPSAPVELEFLQCQSEFLNIQGSGGFKQSGSQGQIAIVGDLAQLKLKLSEFFEFGNFQLGGRIRGDLNWNTSPAKDDSTTFRLSSNSTVNDFAFGFAEEYGWQEKLITLLVATDCRYSNGAMSQLERLETKLQVNDDLASFVLRKPVEFNNEYQSIFDAELNGSAKKWMQRINSLFDLGIELGGEAGISAVVSATPKFIRIRSKSIQIKPFSFRVSSLDIDEPSAKGQLDLVYTREDGSLKANEMQLTTPNTLIASESFLSTSETSHRKTSASFRISGNSVRLSRWFFPSSMVARGAIDGMAQLLIDQKGIHWDSNLASEKFHLLQKSSQPQDQQANFSEIIPVGPAKLISKGSYAASKVQLEKTTFSAKRAAIDLSGLVDLSGPSSQLDLQGNLNTDLQGLLDLFAPQLTSSVQLVGGQNSTFRLRGPISSSNPDALIPDQWNGTAKLSWDQGELFALPLENGGVDVKLNASAFVIEPRNLKVAGGELTAAPKIVLKRKPYSLVIPSGTILRSAEIAPKVFRSWMRYVTPLLADATEAKGRFSIELDRHSVLPLDNPLAGNLSGKLVIESMAVGPGPLGQRLISMTQQWLTLIGKEDLIRSVRDKPWLQLPAQEVKISLDGGKVVHQLLQFNIGEVTIFTSGTVDLNQNVDMAVYIPIQSDWFKDNPVLKSLAGDAIQIPLKGNLANPQLDMTFLTTLSKRIAAGAVGKLLDEKTGGILNADLLKGNLLKNGDKKGNLGKFLEDKAQDLLKKSIFDGLDKLNKKE